MLLFHCCARANPSKLGSDSRTASGERWGHGPACSPGAGGVATREARVPTFAGGRCVSASQAGAVRPDPTRVCLVPRAGAAARHGRRAPRPGVSSRPRVPARCRRWARCCPACSESGGQARRPRRHGLVLV
ncbi:hypothetical protein GQ55_8G153200 [Panicum hallii var. hallii]|uniref:Uncharacterized protein n=1 Tax=Panicum hallii var. hallii TaxID=1504633 RepID=A0A2T7CN75_9POAL|nr:hypothetical protein GQ55_8G153200 [Panicum hallii var. hallii]